MNAADALIALAHFDPARRTMLAALKSNPVRLLAVLSAAVTLVAVYVPSLPVAAIVALLGALFGGGEVVRAKVAPMSKVAVHADDVFPGEVIVAHGTDAAEVLYSAEDA